MTRCLLTPTAALALALAACAPGDTSPTLTDPGDTTAPSLVSSVPADGARGVEPDLSVVLQFSESMDTASVEGHLDVSDLGEVALLWNSATDTLTITPSEPFEVATGPVDGSVAARDYRVIVAPDAMDLAGNEIGEIVSVEFTVVRELWARIVPTPWLTRTVTPVAVAFDSADPLVVGDDEANQGYRAAMTFDLGVLPDTPLAFLSAEVTTEQLPVDEGDPFDGLGTLALDHVEYDDLDTEAAINGVFNATQGATRSYGGIASSEAHVDVSIDVLDAATADLADGRTLSQFLLYFDGFTDLDDAADQAVFSRDDLRLDVTYRVP